MGIKHEHDARWRYEIENLVSTGVVFGMETYRLLIQDNFGFGQSCDRDYVAFLPKSG